MVSGEKRKTLGNVFASALRALQPAVGMRACHRIFCCRSSCLRALSVCEPLLCVGVVLTVGASPAPGVWAVIGIMSLPSGKSWRASGAVSAAFSEGVWMDVVTRLSGKSSRASGSERLCPTDERLLGASVDERLLGASVGATLSGVEPCKISLRTSSVGEGLTVDMEANFPNFLAASSGTASRRGTKIFESFTSSCRRAGCGQQIGHSPEVCGCMKHSFGV